MCSNTLRRPGKVVETNAIMSPYLHSCGVKHSSVVELCGTLSEALGIIFSTGRDISFSITWDRIHCVIT